MKKIEEQHHEVLHHIMERPSEALASAFEDAGYSVDYSNKDVGEEPVKLKVVDTNDMSDEELAKYL